MKIAFDIDNVILDFASVYKQVIKEKFGVDFDLKSYWFDHPGYTDEMFHELIDDIINTPGGLPSCRYAYYLNSFYYTNQQPLIFITARHENTLPTTKRQIENILDPGTPYNIYRERDKDKYKLVSCLDIDYFIEDKPQNIIPCIERGYLKQAFLINQVWNEDFDESKYDKIIRVNNIKEVYHKVLELETSKKYYLAGSFANRELLKIMSEWINIKTDNKLICNSKWLEVGSLSLKEAAKLDTKDLLNSDIVIVSWPFNLGTSYELGLAIATNKPIVLLLDKEITNNGEFLNELEHKVGCLAVGMFDMYDKDNITNDTTRYIVTSGNDLLDVIKLFKNRLVL